MTESLNRDYEVTYSFLGKYRKPGDVKKWKTKAPSELIAKLDFRCLMEDTLKIKRENYTIYSIKCG